MEGTPFDEQRAVGGVHFYYIHNFFVVRKTSAKPPLKTRGARAWSRARGAREWRVGEQEKKCKD